MRGVSLAEWLLFLGVLFLFCAGSYVKGRYDERGTMSLPDTVRVTEYVNVPVVQGVAKPLYKPKRPIALHKSDSVAIHIHKDSVLIAQSEYDSLTSERYWEMDGEHLGHMEVAYNPLERILTYTHTPPPMRVEYVKVTQEREPALTEKLEWAAYGGGVAAVLILLLR